MPPVARRHGRQPRDHDRDAELDVPRVVLLEQRGRFLIGEPFFERGRRVNLDRVRDARPGDLVLVRSGTARRGAPKVERVLGRPDVARVVIEALMLDR
ncbi:MAG: ribonuclease, partial [Solirubrobacteraceae bacterium]|nr:ribonuclease [Solirubrobacteraceae bacterium]